MTINLDEMVQELSAPESFVLYTLTNTTNKIWKNEIFFTLTAEDIHTPINVARKSHRLVVVNCALPTYFLRRYHKLFNSNKK